MKLNLCAKVSALLAMVTTAACGGSSPLGPSPEPTPLRHTRLLAFGDSLTEGKLSDGTFTTPYASVVQSSLATRGEVTVTTDGFGGERVTEARARFVSSMEMHRPQAVLLLHGVNDVNAHEGDAAAAAVADLISIAQSRGATVYLATIPPFTEGGRRAWGYHDVAGYNERLRAIAAGDSRIVLVDVASGWRTDLMGEDGIHPTPEGYRAIGQMFLTRLG